MLTVSLYPGSPLSEPRFAHACSGHVIRCGRGMADGILETHAPLGERESGRSLPRSLLSLGPWPNEPLPPWAEVRRFANCDTSPTETVGGQTVARKTIRVSDQSGDEIPDGMGATGRITFVDHRTGVRKLDRTDAEAEKRGGRAVVLGVRQ